MLFVLPIIFFAALGLLVALLPRLTEVDKAIYESLQQLPSAWLPLAEVVSWLASVNVICVVALAATSMLVLRKRWRQSLAILGSFVAMVAFFDVKETVERLRPINDYVQAHGYKDFSFPSGHATGAMAVYGMIALLLWQRGRKWYSWPSLIIITMLILLVGVSRIFLGAHFASDVVGGWLLGAGFVALMRLIR